MGKVLSDNHISIPNWREKYRGIKSKCENCMRNGYHRTIRNDFGKIIPERINQEWSLYRHIAGPLNPRTKLGNKYMLVAVEGFSNRIWAKAMKDTNAKNRIKVLVELMTPYEPITERISSEDN